MGPRHETITNRPQGRIPATIGGLVDGLVTRANEPDASNVRPPRTVFGLLRRSPLRNRAESGQDEPDQSAP